MSPPTKLTKQGSPDYTTFNLDGTFSQKKPEFEKSTLTTQI